MLDLVSAIDLTQTLFSLALLQQAFEHVFGIKDHKVLYLMQILLSILVLAKITLLPALVVLVALKILLLKLDNGPYNGGADRMNLLVLLCLLFIQLALSVKVKSLILCYLAAQTVLSYFIPGVTKALNIEWWQGRVLTDILKNSGFPLTRSIRLLANNQVLIKVSSVFVILFELSFPLVLVNQQIMLAILVLALIFHLINIYLFGFNRFLWSWLAAYPSLFYFQDLLKQILSS
jgi:hypothetical protein